MLGIASVPLKLSVLIYCVTLGASDRGLRGLARSGPEAQRPFLVDLAGKFTRTNGSLRLDAMEKALATMFKALPKDEHGRIEHSVARYALHRSFLQRRSWHVRGLDPSSDNIDKTISASIESNLTFDYNSVPVLPSLLQNSIEHQHASVGLSLPELAALAASIEDLAHMEALHLLRQAYRALQLPTNSSLSAVDADRAIKTYFVMYLDGHGFPDFSSHTIMRWTKEVTSGDRWPEFLPWMEQVRTNISQQLLRHPDGRQDFHDTARVAEALGENYGRFNEPECLELKHGLMSMEGRKAGRVRLSDFYNQSAVGVYLFREKIDYLRSLGALDESIASDPQVIIANYMLSPTQCLKASSLYHVCCRNECNDLMLALESAVGAPEVGLRRLTELVGDLTSDSVKRRERLPDKLQLRLLELAKEGGGKISLHDHKFALWMHHAFPRECPFPHRSGAVNPQTPDEWIQTTGQTTQLASNAEMQEYIKPDDACSKNYETDLPWLDDIEPILEGSPVKLHGSSSVVGTTSKLYVGYFVCVVCLAAALVRMQYGAKANRLRARTT